MLRTPIPVGRERSAENRAAIPILMLAQQRGMPVSTGIMPGLLATNVVDNGVQRDPAIVPRLLPPAHVAQDVLADRDGLQVVLVAPFQVAGEKLECQSLRFLAIAVPSTLPVTSFTLAVLVALVGGLLFGIGGQRSRPASKNRVAMQSSSNARSAAFLVDRICSDRST